jgi:hypothetical protein
MAVLPVFAYSVKILKRTTTPYQINLLTLNHTTASRILNTTQDTRLHRLREEKRGPTVLPRFVGAPPFISLMKGQENEPDLLQDTVRDWNSGGSNSMMHRDKPLVEVLADQVIRSDIPIGPLLEE